MPKFQALGVLRVSGMLSCRIRELGASPVFGMKQLAILGPGLLGGSLAKAIRARVPQCRVTLWARRAEAAEEARAAGIADLVSSDLAAVVKEADVIVLCMPVDAMPEIAAQMVPLIPPHALVTDVGSVKGCVVEKLAPIFSERGRFVGSHPMAGSEQSGLAAARENLYAGSVCIVTPHEGAVPEAVQQVVELWEQVGCTVRQLSPQEHDRKVGLVSHLPHLLAAALVDFVCSEDPDSVNFCGNGFRDTTRIAAGPAGMWTEIFASNRAALSGQVERMIAHLQGISKDLASGNDLKMNDFLANAKSARDRLNRKD